jgi:uncharacterized MAPEG superfamily protein
MSIASICILIAALLPYIATGLAKTAPGYDNRDPRSWLSTLQGWRHRAHSAHLNSFEAFPLFAIAVLAAQIKAVDVHLINPLAITFVAARILYIVCYIANLDRLRSLVWLVGIGCCVALLTYT